MRLLVCGGRDYSDRAELYAVLDRVHRERGVDLLIAGGAPGADSLAEQWADNRGVPKAIEPALWQKHGKAAGPIRNQLMLDKHLPTGAVAFPGGNGTRDMVNRLVRASIPTLHVAP